MCSQCILFIYHYTHYAAEVHLYQLTSVTRLYDLTSVSLLPLSSVVTSNQPSVYRENKVVTRGITNGPELTSQQPQTKRLKGTRPALRTAANGTSLDHRARDAMFGPGE